MTSIFRRANPAIQELFKKAGSPRKVMCVPIDYAKKEHTALVCNGAGMPLRGPFHIHNNPEGIAFLEKVIAGLCRKHAIRKAHVFFGGEDCSAIASNFTHALVEKGYLGIGVHARDAALERQNQIASTDKLDLLGIASVLINKKWGRTLSAEYGDARILRELTRHRKSLVKAHTASAYRIHHIVDQLLPGFLNDKLSGLTPFSKPSLWVMQSGLAPRAILARKNNAMAEKLRLFMVKNPEEKVRKLKELARSALPAPPKLYDILQINLNHEVSIYEQIERCLKDLEQDIARRLAPTNGAMLTTVPGIALTLASELYAEIGNPLRDRNVVQLSSYAGIVTRLKQTGGPDKEAQARGRSRRACVPLKRCVMDIALKTGQYGHPELKTDYHRREAMGQNPRLTMGRRMLRICTHIMRHGDFFRPPSLGPEADLDTRRDYYSRAWDKVLIKWRDAGAIRQAFAENTPLEQCRQMLNTLYGLNLSNTSPQFDRLRER